ncbi:hypothetical protein CXG81DRAFT_16882 [Caulochytrium protostelioides]|uniref:DUF4874 domain-containing protein n=1 Tax=Caulochytrium protostelioides TaxID=1555241 RepID=A0A4P9X1R1_9FUNG|nr:hypothetical protein CAUPRSCDRAFT_10246 [Caulochytrium protostelioides]RKP03651.1 hypothetical protein CXG81DRAFT_16882 [Caulochytrium protostelioides]|eukprot:RKP03651.1 hypothetical protein CXG81DRAFT_16882 [Caulochytrium protostelioides]
MLNAWAAHLAMVLALSAGFLLPRPAHAVGGWHAARSVDEHGQPQDGGLTWTDINMIKSSGRSIVRIYVNVFQTTDCRQTAEGLKHVMDDITAQGLQVIPRLVPNDGPWHDLNVIRACIAGLEALFTAECANQHILQVQAGFLGAMYGEWWGDNLHDGLAPDNDDGSNGAVADAKKTIVESFLHMGCAVGLRYPRDKHLYFADNNLVGVHNDCINSNGIGGDDSGTFSKLAGPLNSIQTAQRFMAQGTYLKGGEMCTDTASCPELLAHVQQYGIGYLNADFPLSMATVFANGGDCIGKVTSALIANANAAARPIPSPEKPLIGADHLTTGVANAEAAAAALIVSAAQGSALPPPNLSHRAVSRPSLRSGWANMRAKAVAREMREQLALTGGQGSWTQKNRAPR